MTKNKNWQRQEILAMVWLVGGLALAVAFSLWLKVSIPLFTLIFLLYPLINLIRRKDAAHIGMGQIPWWDFIKWTGINLAALIVVYAIFEPWSGAYAYLLEEATAPGASDPTFAWLTRFDGLAGWAGMFLFSGLISIFAEELFFRGWLQNALRPQMGTLWANVIQAALFTLPQLIVAFLMPTPIMGLVYGLVYAFGAIGIINGWVATKAGAIWPNLVAATLMNLILSVLILR
jgi:membrane protease YdiL (CAAX protease family)